MEQLEVSSNPVSVPGLAVAAILEAQSFVQLVEFLDQLEEA